MHRTWERLQLLLPFDFSQLVNHQLPLSFLTVFCSCPNSSSPLLSSGQWFSIMGNFTPRAQLAMSEDIFVVTPRVQMWLDTLQ